MLSKGIRLPRTISVAIDESHLPLLLGRFGSHVTYLSASVILDPDCRPESQTVQSHHN